ncbi:C40 family peptidase [Streptomyces sp. NPDC001941]|uniref:C40 family peptidase n=1 Tax=Streptomyces sp. NPDC001941 TaxID=3154659 RepID=UPI003319D8FD
MHAPEYVEATPADCTCPDCREQPSAAAPARRCGVRTAVAAALGAAALVGTAAGPAVAEPAPKRAGWDGSRYWYKDATGWWRWTSHQDKYLRHAQGPRPAGSAAVNTRGRASEPVFRGSAGWDPKDRVYWYRKNGHWYWTSHQSTYASRTGGSGTGKPSKPTATRPGTSAGHSANPTFRGRAGWDATDRVYWYQRGGGWWWTSHQDKYERYAGTATPTPKPGGGSSSNGGGGGTGTPARYGTERAIQFAMSHLGDPYVWGGNGPHGWDCSGLVKAAYQRAGITLPRVADDQYRATTPITRDRLRRGDLVFWSSNGRASGVHHVAVYLGGGQYLEAPRPGRNVRVSSFSAYDPNLYGRVR